MKIAIGDIIEFKNTEKSELLYADTVSIVLSHGAPGKFRVIGIEEDGTTRLEPVKA